MPKIFGDLCVFIVDYPWKYTWHFLCPNGLVSYNFCLFVTLFNKKYIIRNLHQKLRRLMYKSSNFGSKFFLKVFCLGYPHDFFEKKKFSLKICEWHVSRFSFWWRSRICYYFYENMYRKNKNRKIRAHFGASLKTLKKFHIQ